MPFTPAHPAIIIPLLRSRYFSATGLVIGSISPDFEYFFKMSVNSEFSHTIGGLFYFDLPVSLALAFIFHLVIKKNLVRNLPPFFQGRFQDMYQLDFVKYANEHKLILIISVLTGAGSHIFWDSFTHNNTFFTSMIPLYKTTFIPYEGVRYPLFYALQHISTALGLAIIGVYFLTLKTVTPRHTFNPKVVYWFTLIAIAFFIYMLRFAVDPSDYELGNAIVSSISGFLIALVCCGLINFRNTGTQQVSG
jgi:Domain of unknown function (DUF4184)